MSWSSLHDLALIYLALTHGAGVDPDGDEVVQERLAARRPEAASGFLRCALRDALLVYISPSGQQMLPISVAALGVSLPRAQRLAVLNDLAGIASASGPMVPDEADFLQHLAREWDLEQDLYP